jgi:hypothetical protein
MAFIIGAEAAQLVSDSLQAGLLGFNAWPKQEIFLYSTVSRRALRPTQPPVQWVVGADSPEAKCLGGLGCEANHSIPSSAKVKNGEAILSLPGMYSWRGA